MKPVGEVQDEQGPGEPGGVPDFIPPVAGRGQVPARPVRRPPGLPQTTRALEPWLPSVGQGGPPGSSSLPEGEGEGDLPAVAPEADLPRAGAPKGWTALCFGITFLVYLALVPRFVLYSSPPTGDQPSYLMVTASLAQDHDLNVANNYAQTDEHKFYDLAPHPPGFVGMSAPFPLPPQAAVGTIRPPTESYDYHLPGLGLALVPSWVIGGWFQLWWPATVVFMCLVGALVALNAFLLAHEMTGRLWVAVAVWLPVAFTNPVMSYSYLLFTELPTGLLLIYALRRLAMGWGANGPLRLLLVGLCIAYIPWLAWRCLPLAVLLLAYALVQWLRYQGSGIAGTRLRVAGSGIRYSRRLRSLIPDPRSLFVLAPVAISAMLLEGYDLFLFGTVLPPNRGVDGGSTLFIWPWAGPSEFTQFVTDGFGLLLDRQMGLLPYAPFYLLAAVGMIAMFRSRRKSDRRLLFWIALLAFPYLTLIMAFVYWNGLWCPPARYLMTLVPLMAAPLAMSLHACASWVYRGIYGALAIPGIFLMAIMMYDARLFWPANPVFGWLVTAPESPLKVDVRNALPTFSPIDDLRLPANTAWITVASVLIVFFSYLLMALPRGQGRSILDFGFSILDLPRTHNPKSKIQNPKWTGLAWLGAVSLLGAGWFVMNHDYVKQRTVLYEQGRWDLQVTLDQPYGIAYMDGKIYVTAYVSRAVGALDLYSRAYQPIQPTTGNTPLEWAKPGAVKVGPDGLLWVLNNGEAEKALYVMRPGGQVVREVLLAGKTDVAIGLDLGPDGKLYVSDMVGGAVLKYQPTGGSPIGVLGGQTGGFNNVAGIVVDRDGTVYAADNGLGQIQQMDSGGRFLRKFDLGGVGCKPIEMALNGDWIEVACGAGGLVSVNKQTGAIQKSRVAGDTPPPANITGLTLGPEGLLYVIDRNMIIAYKLQH